MSILVVDDVATDRALIGGLLSKDVDLRVEYAADGAQALEKIGRKQPELVVTDLKMPKVDGLELVETVRAKYEHVPVILITSQGSEDIAAEALQKGAASYVPKRLMQRYLLDTVRRLRALAAQRRSRERLLGSMADSHCRFNLANDVDMIPSLVGYMQETVGHMGLCDAGERFRVSVALEEALVNAMYHGNLELGSELRGDDDDAYQALVQRRREQAPYRDRRIYVLAEMSPAEVKFVVRDDGPGFDPSTLPDCTDPENLEKASGRGVMLMRTFMDEVLYNETGNEVTLVKRRPAAA